VTPGEWAPLLGFVAWLCLWSWTMRYVLRRVDAVHAEATRAAKERGRVARAEAVAWDWSAHPDGPSEPCFRCAGTGGPACRECGGEGVTYRLARCRAVLDRVREALRVPEGESVVDFARRLRQQTAEG
jgi:hypothetical protein